ncbi:MAG TPA: hypothetical protein VJ508_10235, partial [Saprospiraceae bacterium]|nr:hypothetical protein [Saprospiraceae bacterium]
MIAAIRTRLKFILCAGLWCSWLCSSYGQDDMYWTEEAKGAYTLISNLRIDEGLNIIRLQAITFPDNHIWPYLEDYATFLQIFLQEDLRSVSAYMEASNERLEELALVPESNP